MFKPNFTITPLLAKVLMRIEAAREKIAHVPITPHVLAGLRYSARLQSTHYSTAIEGNRLTSEQVERVIKRREHFPGRERDEDEVKGYYVALDWLEQQIKKRVSLSDDLIKMVHALVMGKGRIRVSPTPYRDGQNVIRDGATGGIVYLPPEASDVATLMGELIEWVGKHDQDLAAPLVAGIVHYQFATIHPYSDGNGRSARLLTTFMLHQSGYDLKGLFCLEEYYARDLPGYYQAISIGPSHNYYIGRAQADITSWLEYFCTGMAQACQAVLAQAQVVKSKTLPDQMQIMRSLDGKQRKALTLFSKQDVITSSDVQKLFGFKERSARALCKQWLQQGFLEVVDPSKKGRSYRLALQFRAMFDN
ncbi:MAG: Fic family protein [Epsilonproteobacteria bacterium]|nr:Fic family protein [Campylobacterota bacterium]